MTPLTRQRRWLTMVLAVALTCLGLSRAAAADAQALARLIDQAVDQRLAAEKVPASPAADDAEFLRRVYLDITGVIPSAEKAAQFLDSKDPQKRGKVIDELLASPHYGRHMADIWRAMLLPRNSDNRRLRAEPMTAWLEENFNKNKPWNEFVTDLLTATGPQDKNGAVTFFLANPTADKMTDAVCRLFLGIQLQCAQCHNHPFTHWKQTEYWGMAAFFMKVRPDNIRAAMKQGNTPGITEDARGKQRGLPESAKVVPAKFFQAEEPKLDKKDPYRPVLARWMTSPENPFFARATVNRLWGQFFGRGIVNPVDDFQDSHPPSHPELLQELAQRFAQGGFDVKDLIRTICNGLAYQRTSKPLEGNQEDATLQSHMAVKPLSPEQLFDSLTLVLGSGAREGPRGRKAAGPPAKGMGANARAQFVAFFQLEDGADPTEYQAGIPQALRLMNSQQMNNSALLQPMLKAGQPLEQIADRLYLATLARRPAAEEVQRLKDYVVGAGENKREAYGDILWALLNSSEFALNH